MFKFIVVKFLLTLLVISNEVRSQIPPRTLLEDTDVNYSDNVQESDFEVELSYAPEGTKLNKDVKSSPVPVRRLWGIGDTEAIIGKIFSYSIPDDAFKGDVNRFVVNDLPSWLSFDSKTSTFEGVAYAGDRGHHYISVKAKGNDGSLAKDSFAVHVLDANPLNLFKREGNCLEDSLATSLQNDEEKQMDDYTIASALLAMDEQSTTPVQMVKILRDFAKNIGISETEVWLKKAPSNYDPMFDDSAIMAGPGKTNSTPSSSKQEQFFIEWVSGCWGSISASNQAKVDTLEAITKNGELENALGVHVVGWVVYQASKHTGRIRRAIDFSGDYTEYDYDELPVYDEEFEDPPPSRVIPTLSSPSFGSGPSAVPNFKEEPFDYEGINYVGKGLKPVLMSTPVLIPVKPTKVGMMPEYSPIPSEPSDLPNFGLESSLSIAPTATHSVEATIPLAPSRAPTVAGRPIGPLEPTVVPSIPPPETVYGIKNSAPVLQDRIKKMSWGTGNYYRFKIPENMFYDLEDGNTRNLRLVFKGDKGADIGVNSWIQFDPVHQEIYALPLDDHIKRWTFRLQAIDSGKKSVSDSIHIHVRQPTKVRNYNHKFTATFKLEKKFDFEFKYTLDWQVAALEKIAGLYNSTIDDLNVRFVGENPYKITWTNITLVDQKSSVCPTDALKEISNVIISGHDSEPMKHVKDAFLPEFHLKRIHAHFVSPCKEEDILGSSVDTKDTKPEYKNFPPNFRNQIDHVEFTVGKFKVKQIPPNTCYDIEDGNVRGMQVRLLTADLEDIPNDSWLQFDTTNQEFYGVPLASDIGTKEYFLECLDRKGAKASDALTVTVEPSDYPGPAPVIFTLTVNKNFREFMQDGRAKAGLVNRIASAFGDRDTESVRIRSFKSGSVVVTWFNASLPSDSCPSESVKRLREIVLDDDGNLRKDFVRKFAPEYRISSATVNPSGECLGGTTPTYSTKAPIIPQENDKSASVSRGNEEDYLLTFIIPAVIIALMLVVAAIVACCLYRRRRYGKMTMADERTFVSKGIPIIFAEELDDQTQPLPGADSAKPPVIMKEEKPPLPPPEYSQRGATPPTNMRGSDPRQERRSGSEDTPYHPPPPFTNNQSGRNQRPNMPPAYRKQPTYVPP